MTMENSEGYYLFIDPDDTDDISLLSDHKKRYASLEEIEKDLDELVEDFDRNDVACVVKVVAVVRRAKSPFVVEKLK